MAAAFRLAGRYFETKEAGLDEWIKLPDERVRIGRLGHEQKRLTAGRRGKNLPLFRLRPTLRWRALTYRLDEVKKLAAT